MVVSLSVLALAFQAHPAATGASGLGVIDNALVLALQFGVPL